MDTQGCTMFIVIVMDEDAVPLNDESWMNVPITLTFIVCEKLPNWFILNSPVAESQIIDVDAPGNKLLLAS